MLGAAPVPNGQRVAWLTEQQLCPAATSISSDAIRSSVSQSTTKRVTPRTLHARFVRIAALALTDVDDRVARVEVEAAGGKERAADVTGEK